MLLFRLQFLLFFIIVLITPNICAQQLTVGFNLAGNPPLTFSPQQQKIGIYHEILTAVGKHSGDTFIYKYFPPKRMLVAFERGAIDIEPGINPTWRETSDIHSLYSVPFSVSENIILFARNRKIMVNDPKDLINRRIGTMRGYYYPGYSRLFRSKRIIREDGDSELNLLQRMAGGRLDQIFIQKDVAYYWMSRDRSFSEFEVGNANFKDQVMFRLHPTKTQALMRMNAAIKVLLENGTIEGIYARYR
ncbi:MAG: ABC transporter substrate-binding protein [Psychrosphaera sp.]|nr:ABC transporter substrate-binding protein [Psychrosphaera sp.]